jgi:hypothetical protein
MLTRLDVDVPPALLSRVRGEYLEMPGLRLTAAQAARLWQLDTESCTRVLTRLATDRFLVCTSGGAYVRAEDR